MYWYVNEMYHHLFQVHISQYSPYIRGHAISTKSVPMHIERLASVPTPSLYFLSSIKPDDTSGGRRGKKAFYYRL